MIYCIVCRSKTATYEDLFCMGCYTTTTEEGRLAWRGTLIGQHALCYLKLLELSDSIRQRVRELGLNEDILERNYHEVSHKPPAGKQAGRTGQRAGKADSLQGGHRDEAQ